MHQTQPTGQQSSATLQNQADARGKLGLLVLITVLALALRLYRLAYWGMWTDEGSIWHRSQDFVALLDWNHPPLFPLIFRCWDQVASSLFWWRLLPALLGTITVPLLYFASQRFVGSKAALLAALLLAVNPLHTGESQDLRMYTLLSLEFLVLLWAAKKVISQPQKPFLYALLAAFAALVMLYTQYVAVVFLAALLLAVLPYCLKSRPALAALALALLLVIAGFAPWIPQLHSAATRDGSATNEEVSLARLAATLVVFSAGQVQTQKAVRSPAERPDLVALAGGATLLLGLAVFLGLRRKHRLTWLLVATGFGPMLLLYAASCIKPFYQTYPLMPSLIPLCLLAGLGLAELKLPPRTALLGLLCLVSFSLIAYGYYDPTLQRNRGLGRIAQAIWEESKAGDIVLCDALLLWPLQAHLQGLLPDKGLRIEAVSPDRFLGNKRFWLASRVHRTEVRAEIPGDRKQLWEWHQPFGSLLIGRAMLALYSTNPQDEKPEATPAYLLLPDS